MNPLSILGVPVALAATANALTLGWLEWVSDGKGLDGAQMLLRVAGAAALVAAVAICWQVARAMGTWGFGAFLGVCVAVLTFVLSWIPLLVLVALNPPS